MLQSLPIDLQEYIHKISWKSVFSEVLKEINTINYEWHPVFSKRTHGPSVCHCHYSSYSPLLTVFKYDSLRWMSFTSWSRLKPTPYMIVTKDICCQHLRWG